ncbi:MAG: MarR family transcriptional regulator [Chloroflexota bacterium]
MVTAPSSTPEIDADAAERIRLAFADAWGQMGSAWGVQPSVARVHGYLLAHGGTLTERQIREALELSHRAASMALAEIEDWGLIERVPDPSKGTRRGPSATAWRSAGDRWLWFQRIAEERKAREADPLVPRIQTCLALAQEAVRAAPGDPEVVRLRDWMTDLLGFIRLFDRAVSLLARADSSEISKGFSVLARLSDDALDRLLRLVASLPEEELVATIDALSRVSPGTARKVLTAAHTIARIGR